MSYRYFNPNPRQNLVGDCVIRAIAKATNQDWDTTYLDIVVEGFTEKDMPSSNVVWHTYLISNGYHRYIIPDKCPNCYTVRDFCRDNPKGIFILATGSHVIAVVDEDYYDTWDSGNEIPIYYYVKEY